MRLQSTERIAAGADVHLGSPPPRSRMASAATALARHLAPGTRRPTASTAHPTSAVSSSGRSRHGSRGITSRARLVPTTRRPRSRAVRPRRLADQPAPRGRELPPTVKRVHRRPRRVPRRASVRGVETSVRQRSGVDVVLLAHRVSDRGDVPRLLHELPHSRADLVQAEVDALAQLQQHRLAVEHGRHLRRAAARPFAG